MTTLKALCKNVKIESRYGQISQKYESLDDWQKNAHPYRCTLKYQGRQYSFDFFMGQAHTDEPTAAGTLDCLLSDAQGGEMDFSEFCREFGYDKDSRRAEKIHKACQKTTEGIKRLFGDNYEKFLYADRN